MDTNRWLSADDREALQKKEAALRELKYGSRRNKAVTLDLAGRKVLEEDKTIGVCVNAVSNVQLWAVR